MKGLIALLLFAGAVFSVYRYAFPAANDIKTFRAQLAEMEDLEKKAVEAEAARDKAVERLRAIGESNLAQLDMLLPEQPPTEDLYVFFDVITNQAGIQLDLVKVTGVASRDGAAKEKGVPGKKSQAFELSVTGSYDKLRTFLDTLERNMRLSNVRSFDITMNAKEEFTVKIQGSVYYAD